VNSIKIKNAPLNPTLLEKIQNEIRDCLPKLREKELSQVLMDKDIQIKKELILTFCAQQMLKYTKV
jgi:hypothetical protein